MVSVKGSECYPCFEGWEKYKDYVRILWLLGSKLTKRSPLIYKGRINCKEFILYQVSNSLLKLANILFYISLSGFLSPLADSNQTIYSIIIVIVICAYPCHI